MSCTTILVGRGASLDGSTIIARNDDSPSGVFTSKKLVKFTKDDLPEEYVSKISHVRIPLDKENALSFTAMPNVDSSEGVWAACGVNRNNVAMSATETTTTNPRILGADPYVVYEKGKTIGGIGEEDLVYIILPFIKSAKEGVLLLGSLLEKYGTYESNGIAFSDEKEIWFLETIGGHHWIAKKVPDYSYVVMPNQYGIDEFDFDDKRNCLCSSDMKEFLLENHLTDTIDIKRFNPRVVFGSHDDSDHVYNTPRAWYIGRYFNSRSIKWDGENAQYTPYSDDIPWSFAPDKKITIEDVKYALSSHYQGTDYDCYGKDNPNRNMFRPIGISRTSFLGLVQIRPYAKKNVRAIEWFSFGSNPFNVLVPFFIRGDEIPSYYGKTPALVDSNSFYWANRLIGALVDSHYKTAIIHVERYQLKMMAYAHKLIKRLDDMVNVEQKTIEATNKEMADYAKKETQALLDKVLYDSSNHMKNSFSRSDN